MQSKIQILAETDDIIKNILVEIFIFHIFFSFYNGKIILDENKNFAASRLHEQYMSFSSICKLTKKLKFIVQPRYETHLLTFWMSYGFEFDERFILQL